MTTQQLVSEALSLPLDERITLAQVLWASIDAGREEMSPHACLQQALVRDDDLTSGRVAGVTHEQIMIAARRSLPCS